MTAIATPRLKFHVTAAATAMMLFLLIALASRSWADAPEFDFHPPSSATDPAAPAIMRDLAERLLPVYQDADPDRYLMNLSALQMVAGNYSAADVSRQSLRDRRRRADLRRPVGHGVIFDIYAYAKAIETENRVSFQDAFTRAYHEVIPSLNDLDTYLVMGWFAHAPVESRDALQRAFDQLRPKDSITDVEAMQLVWAYLSFDAYRQFGPLAGTLDAEDDQRRYVTETVDAINSRGGVSLAALVIRPRNAAKPLPALLEFTLGESQNYAKECAARGYVGVVAYARGTSDSPRRVVPFQNDGDDARAVIEWIAKQSWSDGRVGMYGEGYSGFASWAAARQAPPALKAIATAAPSAPGVDFPMRGGIFRNSAFRWLLGANHSDPSIDNTAKDDAVWRALDQKWYTSGERYRDLGRLSGTPNPIFIRWLNHPSYDRYWQKMIPYKKQFASVSIPVLTTTGYFAGSEPGALYYFTQHLRYNPHADHTLIIGPYDDSALRHGPPPDVRGYHVDSAALVDLHDLRYQWFDHIFKGAAVPAFVKDRVNYEVMGGNTWRHAPSLDGMDKESRRFYLDVNKSGDSHPLTLRKPVRARFIQQKVSFVDRSDAAWVPATNLAGAMPALHNGTMFVSEPLSKAIEFTGLFSGRLEFTVNKMDMDLEISLYERTADGDYVRLFSPSYEFRASYIRDRVHRHLLKAGEREELTFKSERMTSRHMNAGSRLVMVLEASKRPDREINYGTGNDVSEESITDGKTPLKVRWYGDSYIDVPLGK
jgi:putative CocE/NonD family hydrolase